MAKTGTNKATRLADIIQRLLAMQQVVRLTDVQDAHDIHVRAVCYVAARG